ncbi:MAG: 3-oxoacyl-(acyl-carrier-protein) synthase/pimeloyl-ACP methyl ester carboxylesterase, partial [bacterium]
TSGRWERTIVEYPEKQLNTDQLPLRNNGVYLITGGLGGLGLIFAKYLTQYQPKLILTGRSQLTPEKESKLEQLQKLGAEAIYISADISTPDGIKELVQTAKSRFQSIHGIIHSAGIKQDTFLLKKEKTEFDQVLSPKVDGTLLLDEFTKKEPLDFFILFSSIASITGNAGQIDYAYANSFQDHFATVREEKKQQGLRSGKTLSINWPLWKEGGMHVDRNKEQWFKKKFGMIPMSTKNGYQAFSQALISETSQLIVIEGQKSIIKKNFGLDQTDITSSVVSSPKEIDENTLEEKTEKYLRGLLSEILKLPQDKIEQDASFDSYGLDSLMLTQFNNEIAEQIETVSQTLLYEHQTLETLVDHLLENHRAELLNFLHIVPSSKSETNKVEAIIQPLDENELEEKIETALRKILSSILKIPEEKIESDSQFDDYGLDSLMLTQFNSKIAEYIETISQTVLYENQTLEELTNHILDNHKNEAIEWLGKQQTSTIQIEQDRLEVESIPDPVVLPSELIPDSQLEAISDKIQEIAIIGLSAKLPGAKDQEEFWENLKTGKNIVTEIPAKRWNKEHWYDEDKDNEQSSYCKWGCFLDDVDQFDPLLFNISPKEAVQIDPQERLFLQIAWETLEDAGYQSNELGKVGVFAGATTTSYPFLALENQINGEPVSIPNPSFASLANRVSYYFDFDGPSMPVDTMCSSAITAIHMACESLRRKECSVALAGAVNLYLHPSKYLTLSNAQLISDDGVTRSFSQNGIGFVPGEAVGAFLLKPLNQAITDGDNIYATIKGSAISHSGRTTAYQVPNPNSQAKLIQQAIKNAGITPDTITHIEAAAVGSKTADPIEIAGLKKAFGQPNNGSSHCSISSVKPNVGHAEAASGIAQMIKVLLQFKKKERVPSIHSEPLNFNINFDKSPFELHTNATEWKKITNNHKEIPRRAGINSFGAGGAGAHIILEEYQQSSANSSDTTNKTNPVIIPIAGNSKESLKGNAKKLLGYLQKNQETSLFDLGWTLQVGRKELKERLVFLVNQKKELIKNLEQLLTGNTDIADFFSTESTLKIELSGRKKEIQNQIQHLLEEKNYSELCALWVHGYKIDWKILHKEQKRKRISLPTYSFEQRSCWFKPIPAKAIISKEGKRKFIELNRKRDEKEIKFNNKIGYTFKYSLDMLSDYFSLILLEYLNEKEIFNEEKSISLEEWKKKLNFTEEYGIYYDIILDYLQKDQIVTVNDTTIELTKIASSVEMMSRYKNRKSRKEFLLRAFPEFEEYFNFLDLCRKNFDLLLTGQKNWQDLLVTKESEKWIQSIYQGNHRFTEYCSSILNKSLERYITLFEQPKKEIRILEVGSGTWGLSQAIVKFFQNHYEKISFYSTNHLGIFSSQYQESISNEKTTFYPIQEADLETLEKESFDFIYSRIFASDDSNQFLSTERITSLLSEEGLLLYDRLFETGFFPFTLGLIDPAWRFVPENLRIQQESRKSKFQKNGLLSDELLGHWMIIAAKEQEDLDIKINPVIESPVHENISINLEAYKESEFFLKGIFSNLLGMTTEELSVGGNLSDYGVSSLLISKAFVDIEQKYPSMISIEELMSQPTIQSLGELLAARNEQEVEPSFSPKDLVVSKELSQVRTDYLSPFTKNLLKKEVFTSSNQIEYEFYTCGEGEPILFLTALAFTCGIWEHQIAHFHKRFQLIFPHLPGHAGSNFQGKPFTFEQIADDLAELLDYLKIPRVHLAGWCMAGNIGQLFAHRHADRLQTLSLICTTPTDARVRGLNSEDLKEYAENPLGAYELEFQNIFRNLSFDKQYVDLYVEFIANTYSQVELGAVAHYINNLFRFDATPWLQKISVPSFVIAGQWDIAFPPEQVRLLSQKIENSRFHSFDNSGHMPFLSESPLFNYLLEDFITSHSSLKNIN